MSDIERAEHSSPPLQSSLKVKKVGVTHPAENTACISTMSVYQSLKSLLFTCALGGLLFKKNFAASGIKKHLSVTHVYSCVLLIVHITNFLRWLTMFDGDEKFGIFLFIKVSYCVWCLECVGHFVASFLACECYHRLPEFFTEWEKIRPNCSRSLNSIKRLTTVCTVILCILVFANSAFSTYLTFGTTLQDVILTPWNREQRDVVVIQFMNMIHCIYLSFAWFGPSVLMFVICKILAYEFKKINNRVKDLSRLELPSCAEKIGVLRGHHQDLCNLVANADDIFSMQIAISFIGSLIIACLMMYIIVYDDDPTSSVSLIVIIKGFWVCVSLARIMSDCVSGAILNEAVSYYHKQAA